MSDSLWVRVALAALAVRNQEMAAQVVQEVRD
jgi:hypothetical protein